MQDVFINDGLSIPAGELEFSASRAAGPGGQHVNKVSSRVTLQFDLQGSPSLSEAQKRRITDKLPTRITKAGVLQVHCQKHRSQAMNRELAVERFAELLCAALRRDRPRKKTRVSRAEKQRRLEAKRRRSELKRQRSRRFDD